MAKIKVDIRVVDDAGAVIGQPFTKEIPDVSEKQIENFIDAAYEFGAKCEKQLQKDKKK